MIDAILYQTTRIISLYFEKYFSLPLQFFSLTQFFLYLIFVEFFFFFIFIYNFEFNCQLPCHFPYFTLISFQPFSGWIWVFFFIFHLIKKKKKSVLIRLSRKSLFLQNLYATKLIIFYHNFHFLSNYFNTTRKEYSNHFFFVLIFFSVNRT